MVPEAPKPGPAERSRPAEGIRPGINNARILAAIQTVIAREYPDDVERFKTLLGKLEETVKEIESRTGSFFAARDEVLHALWLEQCRIHGDTMRPVPERPSTVQGCPYTAAALTDFLRSRFSGEAEINTVVTIPKKVPLAYHCVTKIQLKKHGGGTVDDDNTGFFLDASSPAPEFTDAFIINHVSSLPDCGLELYDPYDKKFSNRFTAASYHGKLKDWGGNFPPDQYIQKLAEALQPR